MVALATLFLAAITLDTLTAPPPLPSYAQARASYRPSEAWLYDRNGRLLDAMRVDFQSRRLAWTPLDQVSPEVAKTVVAVEDRRFRLHEGIDWLSVGAALRDRLRGRSPRGASTLSMQAAAFLSKDLAAPGARGWRDKLRQMRAAWALEDGWSKDQILEAYLNLASFRGELQGIGAASFGLFGKAPAALGPDEALLLAALLRNPGAAPERVAARACDLIKSSPERGGGPAAGWWRGPNSVAVERRAPSTAVPAVPLPVPGRICDNLRALAFDALGPTRALALDPALAPHLAAKLLTKPGLRIATTLDADVQRLAATALRRQLQGLGPSRARDGAVVVVDNATGEVLAYVGGVGGASTAGQVDGADAYRQAGSTLKPFLYAAAIERGFLTPASILDDSPVQLDTASGLYVPQNYDHAFKGPVSVRTALAGSLNVPAVRTLLLEGVESFRDRLSDTGYRGLTEDGDYYGFSLALGSAEVTLLEQANAYRTLANAGRWSPLRIRPNDKPGEPRAVFTPAAAWIVSDILADADARARAFGLDSALRLPFWASAKTGTSKAMRDNWCIGFSNRFTVAVWIGNLEGDSMRAVSGTSGAAPVWREVMLALHANRPGREPPPPPSIEQRVVRFDSGIEPPRREYFLAGTAQAAFAAAPAQARRPRIVSPVAGSIYALDPDIPLDRQRLAVRVAGVAPEHRLVLDRRDLGLARDSMPLLVPPGAHRLALLDGRGRVVDSLIFSMR
jgi:penicillin-binding protein 1C